jgi:hypothetical protein
LSRKFDSPVTLSLGGSRRLGALIVCTYGGAIALGFTLPLPWWGGAVAAGILGWRALVDLRSHALRVGADSVVGISLDDAGRHVLYRRGGTTEAEFQVLTRFVDPRLTILTVRSEDRKRRTALLVPGDAVDGEEFRRWRARLRLQTSAE